MRLHAPTEQHQATAWSSSPDLAEDPHPLNVGREHAHDHTRHSRFSTTSRSFSALASDSLARPTVRVDVGAVGEQEQPNAFVTELTKPLFIGE